MIAGLGLIGGSVAKALKKKGIGHLFGYDGDVRSVAAAEDDGIIKTGYSSLYGDMPAFDLVICCLAPYIVADFYREIKPHLKDVAVFAEFGGLKKNMNQTLIEILGEKHELLPLHPMAGSEKTGYAHSDAALFKGSLLIMTPTEKTGGMARFWADVLKQAMGSETMIELTADAHDDIIAHISHIPHIAALAVKAMNNGGDNERFAGGSYHAVTRVADINSALWAGLLTDNREYLRGCIAQLKQNLDMLDAAIDKGDPEALEMLLRDMSGKKE